MSSSVSALNSITADPEFSKLAPEDQKALLLHLSGSAPSAKPPGLDLGSAIQMEGQPSYDRKTLDTGIDVARPFVAGVLGDAAATVTAPIPVPGSSLAAYGGTYTLADTLMQYLKEKKPESFTGALGEGLVNAGAQKVTQGLVKGTGKVINAVRDAGQPFMDYAKPSFSWNPEVMNLEPTTSQALAATGREKLAAASKYFEDIATSSKNKALDRTAGKGFAAALKFIGEDDLSPQRLSNLANDYMPQVTPVSFVGKPRASTPISFIDRPVTPSSPVSGQTQVLPGETRNLSPTSFSTVRGVQGPTDPIDKVIANPDLLQDTLSRAQGLGTGANLKKTLGNYQFAKIFNAGAEYNAEGSVRRINSNTIEQLLGDPDMQESYKKLYGSEGFSNVKQFFKNISYTQDKVGSGTYRKLWLMEGGIAIAGSFLTNVPIVGGATTAVGGYIGARTLGSLLNNPTTARIMVNLSSGAPLGVSEQYAGKIIVRALQGSTIALLNDKGEQEPVKVTPQGLQLLN